MFQVARSEYMEILNTSRAQIRVVLAWELGLQGCPLANLAQRKRADSTVSKSGLHAYHVVAETKVLTM